MCETQFEPPEALEARYATQANARLEKRREDIKAFGGDLPMRSASYYFPFEIYASPRDKDDKAVFEFVSDDVGNHKMQAKKAAPASTLNLVTEHIIEVCLGILLSKESELMCVVANHGQIRVVASRN